MSVTFTPCDLALFTEHLAVITRTSVPLPTALRQLATEFRRPQLRAALETLATDMEKNGSLAAALTLQPRAFPSAYAALLAAGEKNGTLPESLSDLTKLTKIQIRTKKAYFDSVNYEITFILFAAIFLFSVLWWTVSFVTGHFATVFSDLAEGKEYLPWLTEQVLYLAKYVMPWFFGSAISLSIFLLCSRFSRFVILQPLGRDKVSRTFALGNWARWLGTALKQNLSLDDSLYLTRQALQDRALARATTAVQEKLQQGQAFGEVLAAQPILSPLTLLGLEPSLSPAQLSARFLQISELLQQRGETALVLSGSKQSWPFILFWFCIVVTIVFCGLAVLSLFLPLLRIISSLQG